VDFHNILNFLYAGHHKEAGSAADTAQEWAVDILAIEYCSEFGCLLHMEILVEDLMEEDIACWATVQDRSNSA